MKKMETSEAGDEDESCRSSEISDLEELEANLYSYVHHEKNVCFEEENSTSYIVSNVEGISLHNVFLGENVDRYSLRCTSGRETRERCTEGSEVEELSDSACLVTSNESDIPCPELSESNVTPVQVSGKEANKVSVQSRDSSPEVLEVSSSDDLIPVERSVSKYGIPAASTPVKEFVVIDDSDEEVQIQYEKVATKSKKRKKGKQGKIKEDIKLNTRSRSEVICLDEEIVFSEKENVDSLLIGEEYENSDQERSLCKSWTPQMAQFYDESWGGELINLNELQRTMSDDGWKVDISDEFYSLTSKFQNRRYFGVSKSKGWCTRCNQKGHYRNNCTEKITPPRCHRCGSSKHQEYSCNQKICLNCGRFRPSLVAVCQQCRQLSRKKCYICQQPGHPPGCCPDLWRRFHATVAPGDIVAPQKVPYKDPKNIYCCNCASRGHHVFQCKKDNFSDYIPMNPKVASYVNPEVLLKFQNTCSHTPSNWERIGGIAPEYEDGVKPRERGIKRPKTSGNQQSKSKQRKLEDMSAPESESTKISSHENGKISGKLSKKKDKKSTKLKAITGLKSKKRSLKPEKCAWSGDSRKQSTLNPKLEKEMKHNDPPAMKGGEAEIAEPEKEITGPNANSGLVERMVVLSPGHLKIIESDEGKEIVKYATAQFQGVRTKVSQSGILKFLGTVNDIEQVKVHIFDILNNKCRLDQLKMSSTTSGNDLRGTKKNRAHVAVIRSKRLKKKFHNGVQCHNGDERKSKDQVVSSASNAENCLEANGNRRQKIRKKQNSVTQLQYTSNSDKGTKLNRKGKQRYWESAVCNEIGEHSRRNPGFDPVMNYPVNVRHMGSSEGREVNNCKTGISEVSYDVNEGATQSGINCPRSTQSNPKFSVNRNKCKRRNKKKGYADVGKAQFRGNKQGVGRRGMYPVGNKAKKRQQKMALGQDNLGLVTVEVGHKRKVSFADEYINDHSRIPKNQTCSRNGFNARYFQGSSSREYSPHVS